jgi:hypothetical protein
MEEQDEANRDRPQPVDIRPVFPVRLHHPRHQTEDRLYARVDDPALRAKMDYFKMDYLQQIEREAAFAAQSSRLGKVLHEQGQLQRLRPAAQSATPRDPGLRNIRR